MSKVNLTVLALPLVMVAAGALMWVLTFLNYLQDGRVHWTSILGGFFALILAWLIYTNLKKRHDKEGGG